MSKFVEFDGELINLDLVTNIRFLPNEKEDKKTKKTSIVDYEVQFIYIDGETTFEQISRRDIEVLKSDMEDAKLVIGGWEL